MPNLSNYLPDTNPFKLAGPPSWWLRRLWDFDASLVVVPSRQTCIYRLAQRRHLKLPEHIVNESLFKESDTQMLASYSLIPVTTILPTANWSNPFLFQELRNRAPHMQGGAEAVTKRLEDAEFGQHLKDLAVQDDMTTRFSKEGWKQYRKRIGLGKTLFT